MALGFVSCNAVDMNRMYERINGYYFNSGDNEVSTTAFKPAGKGFEGAVMVESKKGVTKETKFFPCAEGTCTSEKIEAPVEDGYTLVATKSGNDATVNLMRNGALYANVRNDLCEPNVLIFGTNADAIKHLGKSIDTATNRIFPVFVETDKLPFYKSSYVSIDNLKSTDYEKETMSIKYPKFEDARNKGMLRESVSLGAGLALGLVGCIFGLPGIVVGAALGVFGVKLAWPKS